MSCSKKNPSLALVVDRQANRVLWAEAGGDVVDVLLSFLTLPLGTAVRLLGKKSGIGCVDELYESVEALDQSCFQAPSCKDMLLRPRSAAERLCQDLPVKVDDGDPVFYACSKKISYNDNYWPCCLFSSVKGTSCRCQHATDRSIRCVGSSAEAVHGVFLEPGGRFCISDDLYISPLSASTTILLLLTFGQKESKLEYRKVELSREIVLKLLQKSLTSKTPLTDTFLQESERKPTDLKQLHRRPAMNSSQDEEATAAGSAHGRVFKAKLVKSSSRNEVMYAEVGEDTVDLLFSFLTFPLGSIARLMAGDKASDQCNLGCIDKLYQSVLHMCDATYCAMLEKHRATLLDPKIATHFGCSNQLLDVDEITSFETTMNTCHHSCCAKIPAAPSYCSCCSKSIHTARQINPKLGNGVTSHGGGFAKGKPGTFMVTDQVMVMPTSSFSGFNIMKGRNVYADDIELMEVNIGRKEALALLKGLLLSKAPLTHAFCQTK